MIPSKISKWLVFLLWIFILQEIALRICFPLPELENFNRIKYQTTVGLEDKRRYIRDIELIWQSSLDSAKFGHKLNRYGFRDREWTIKKTEGKKRVFFVGDSFTEGLMAEQDETIPATFQKEAGKKYEVFNCGMAGIGINRYIEFIVDVTPVYKPDIIFMIFYSNDYSNTSTYIPIPPAQLKRYNIFRPRLLEIIDANRENSPIPFRWSREKRPFLYPVPDPSNYWTENEHKLIEHTTAEVAREMKAGRFNYFSVNWVLFEQEFLTKEISVKERLQLLKDYLQPFGTELVVCYIPSKNQVSTYYYPYLLKFCRKLCPPELDLTGPEYQVHQKLIGEKCRALKLQFIDLTDVIRAEELKGNHLYWEHDDHMRGKGYQILGKYIYQQWIDYQKKAPAVR